MRTGGRRTTCRSGRSGDATTLPGDDHLAPDGRVMEAVGAPVPGLAGGLPAHGAPRPVQLLRGVHPHHRLGVQPARQVAQDHQPHSVAGADRIAELPAVLARLAPGPQRPVPPGPGIHRPCGQQEGRSRPGVPATGHQHKNCPSVHDDLDGSEFLLVGPTVDSAGVDNVLPGEGVVRIKREVVIDAVQRYLAR